MTSRKQLCNSPSCHPLKALHSHSLKELETHLNIQPLSVILAVLLGAYLKWSSGMRLVHSGHVASQCHVFLMWKETGVPRESNYWAASSHG